MSVAIDVLVNVLVSFVIQDLTNFGKHNTKMVGNEKYLLISSKISMLISFKDCDSISLFQPCQQQSL